MPHGSFQFLYKTAGLMNKISTSLWSTLSTTGNLLSPASLLQMHSRMESEVLGQIEKREVKVKGYERWRELMSHQWLSCNGTFSESPGHWKSTVFCSSRGPTTHASFPRHLPFPPKVVSQLSLTALRSPPEHWDREQKQKMERLLTCDKKAAFSTLLQYFVCAYTI